MNKLFDSYGRNARLFPAILCAFPFLLLNYFIFDTYLKLPITTITGTLIENVSVSAVLIYLLSQANRVISKELFQNKSKFPTVQMLLASSKELSIDFRNRIDEKVNKDFKFSLPNLSDEQTDAEGAKIRIAEIVHLIINKVGKGKLLFQHNIEYGFARNYIGGTVIALPVSILAALVFKFVIINSTAFIFSCVLTVFYLVPLVFSPRILRNFSREYANILFREYVGGIKK